MEVAVASLERSVRALFTPSTATNSAPAHALCECALEQVPPPDWQYLRRFPVLKRHVLREFRSVATEVAKMPPTPRKRAKRSTWQQRSDLDEYKAICLASLCQKLAQCELFTRDEGEVLDAVVALESLAVLQRVIGGKLLPLRVRMLLLGWALRCQEKTCRETAVQQWIQQVGEKLLEELIEVSASSETSQVLSVKRVRTRAACGKQVVERRESVRDDTSSCRFCRDGASADILWSKCGSGELLIACAQRTARVLEKAGESYATNKAMMALSAFWDLRPAARLISGGRTSRRRKHSEISSVMTEQPIEPSMTISAYREIGKAAARSAASATCAFQTMWTSVWERECKHMTQMEHITLVDAVRHCSKVDEFASMVMLPEARMRITHFPGFLVVLDVIESLSIDMSTIISAFAIVWDSTYAGAFLRSTTLTRTSTSPSRRILRSYLRELLKSRGLRHRAISSSSNTSSAWSRTSPLGLLFSLFEIFSEVEPGEQQDSSYFRQWDAFMSQASTEVSRTDCTQGGIAWCMFLEECVLSVGAKKTLTTSHRDMDFLRSFQRYCHTIMHGIVVTGGEVISSGGSIYRQLIRGEGDRLVVRRVLVRMMITFEETWTIDLIALLLRSSASFHISSKMDERGMIHLLFPALASFMKSTCGANVNERKTRQQQFAAIVNSINVVLKDSEPTASYLVQLMRFCEAWDVYQSSHTKEAPSKANRWGFHAMVELDVVAELLECYSKDDVIHQETRGALDFASEVLQSAPHCPPSLEGGLWRFLSAVKARTEEGLSTTSDLLDRELVSHSSNVLQRFLRAVRFADVAQTRQLMSQMKDTVGTFGELRQQLERWFSFVEVNGAAFAAKESRLELSVLCTRLIRWFPNEFEDMRFLLMTPLDPHLVFTLKAFVKEAGKLNGKTHRSKLSSAATSLSTLAVRIEMALHSYLSAAALPDLETLSVLLVKAVVKCRSPDAFDDLTKVIQKNSRVLLPETTVATLSSPLRGLEFSNCAIQQNEDNDDGRMALRAQRAKSIIYQENTLKLLARSASIFDGGLSWSSALFNVQSAVTYLPILFDYVLQTGFCDGALQADLLLTCLNELRQQADGGARVLREAYWIAAVLHTALMSGSRRIAGAYAISNNDVLDRLRATTGDVLQLLSIAANTTAAPTGCNIDGATTQLDEVLCLLKLSKVARLAIADNRASCYWSCERLISDKAHRALQTVVSSAWTAATNRAQDMAVMPAMQLFVPFASWLTAALVYSQSFLEDPSAHVRRWERTFTGYVTDLYLHLEFEDVTGDLLETWLTTWITANIVRGQDEVPLLALLPSQVALFRRLASTPYREMPPGERNRTATSIWRLVFAALNVAVDTREEQHPVELGQAVELILHTLTTLELVELSASSDFVHCSHEATVEPFFQELERFLLQLHRRVGSVAQVCCLLQYPLELLVCCYVCNMAVHCNAESQRFLQRVRDLLQANVENIGDVLESIDDDRKLSTVRDPSRQSDSDKEHGESQSQLSATSQSADIEAFFHLWADEMALKYDYVDQERCKAIIEVIQAALHVSEHAPNRKTVSVETGPRDG